MTVFIKEWRSDGEKPEFVRVTAMQRAIVASKDLLAIA
jgi:hypothetical protein